MSASFCRFSLCRRCRRCELNSLFIRTKNICKLEHFQCSLSCVSCLRDALWWKFIWAKTFAFMFISLFLPIHVPSKNYSQSEVVNWITSAVVRDTNRSHWVGKNRIMHCGSFWSPNRVVRRAGNIGQHLFLQMQFADCRLCGRSEWGTMRICRLHCLVEKLHDRCFCFHTPLRLMWWIQLF